MLILYTSLYLFIIIKGHMHFPTVIHFSFLMMNQSLGSASSFTDPHQGVWGNGLCFSSCGGKTQFTRAYFCTTSTKPACHEVLWQCETFYQIRRKTARATKHFFMEGPKTSIKQACVLWLLITPSGSADPNEKHPQETLTINTSPES